MMATKERNFQPLPEYISLEDLVPEDNFYRRLQQKLDLSFVRDLVENLYAASGRPSVDPEVFFRLQLVMFYEGICSERELMRIVSDSLSVRWYVGYENVARDETGFPETDLRDANKEACGTSARRSSWPQRPIPTPRR